MSNSFDFSYLDADSYFISICTDLYCDFGKYLRDNDFEDGAFGFAVASTSSDFHSFCVSIFDDKIIEFYSFFLAQHDYIEDDDKDVDVPACAEHIVKGARYFVEHFGVVARDLFYSIRRHPDWYGGKYPVIWKE